MNRGGQYHPADINSLKEEVSGRLPSCTIRQTQHFSSQQFTGCCYCLCTRVFLCLGNISKPTNCVKESPPPTLREAHGLLIFSESKVPTLTCSVLLPRKSTIQKTQTRQKGKFCFQQFFCCQMLSNTDEKFTKKINKYKFSFSLWFS